MRRQRAGTARGGGVSERGSIALLTALAGAALAFVAAVALLTATDLAAAAARARAGADASALAAVAASPLAGGDGRPCEAAASLAGANSTAIVTCSGTADPYWPLRVQVTVTAAPTSPLGRLVVPGMTARAAAGLRPALHTARAAADPVVQPAVSPRAVTPRRVQGEEAAVPAAFPLQSGHTPRGAPVPTADFAPP